ncbi:MAG TPA: hypothetical protein VJT73_11905, partial [Polyangiaceae bacterium]|nr:hypothetical protein [Polyangiaceae bacterium]
IPVEQMAYYVNRSEALRRLDPDLKKIVRLSEHVAWMSGIQFYLTEDVKITAGHVDCLDSEWHLTAISQTQFWHDVDMKERGHGAYRGKVKSILSVDISAWDQKGQLHRREAFACTRQQIAEEVWDQLKRSLNRPNQAPELTDEMLLGQKIDADSFYLDDDIAERLDRKKQAFYTKFESVRFSSEAILARQASAGGETLETSIAYGDRAVMNAEPLLVNRAGALPLRPTARTNIGNLFLAADYVRTTTNLATMEGANEAARLAVNEILADAGSSQRPCEIFPLWQPTDLLRLFGDLLASGSVQASLTGVPARLAGEAVSAVSAATRAATRTLSRLIDKRR